MSNLIKLCALLSVLLLSACGSNGVEIISHFKNTNDIREGSPVYVENTIVGVVTRVSELEAGVRVEIELEKEAATMIKARSAVVVNRLKMGAPLQLYSSDIAHDIIQPGQEIEGLDSMFQLGAWMVGDAIQLGTDSVNDYVGAFQEYLDSDQFQQDKAVVSATVNEVSKMASESIKQVESELTNALDDLSSSEKEMAAAVEQLGDELAPVVEEFGRTGSKLSRELEEFSRRLESASAVEKESGQQFLDSLVATLEQLNDSMEKGAAGTQPD